MVGVSPPTRDQLARIAQGDNRLLIALEALFEASVDAETTDNLLALLGGSAASVEAKQALLAAGDALAAAMMTKGIPQGTDGIPSIFPQHRSNGHVVDYVDFARNGPHVTLPLRMQWNDDDGTIDVGLNGDVVLQVGQEMLYYAKNTSGVTIANGAPVVASGTVGASGKLTIAPAIADGTYAQKYYIGVATEDIAHNDFGYVASFGLVRGLDTSSYTDGDLLYVSDTTAGTWTTTQPSAPNWKQAQAIVVYASSGSSGSIFSRRTGEHSLGELQDVDLTGLADGDLLQWDSTSGTWQVITGASGSFTTADAKTVTVTNGVITAIV